MDILQEILDALRTEESVMLATIISTNGSTPASALSKMLVKDGGKKWLGTIGGGCVEGDVLQEAIQLYNNSAVSKILRFELNETNIDQGLICGGNLDVMIESLSRKDIGWLSRVKAVRDEGEDCVVATIVSTAGTVAGKRCIELDAGWNDGMVEWWNRVVNKSALTSDVLEAAVRKAHRRNETERLKIGTSELILEPVQGLPSLIIFGGGHVSKYVSRSAAMTGFRVTVVDDRPEYANAQRFPEAYRTLAMDFGEALDTIEVKPSTYIVIVTRGHRSDEEILSRVIASPAKYIGMIGSQRKVLTTYEHLAKRGVSHDQLKRVHAPIGIDIGATTAEEIGISIVAQLIAVRRGEAAKQKNKSEAIQKSILTKPPS